MANKIEFSVLEDGTISVKTDDLAGTNHYSADELLKQIASMAGGETVTKKRFDVVKATHHSHDHLHHGGAGGHTH